MLDVRYIAENLEEVKTALANRSGVYDPDKVARLYNRKREILKEVEVMKATRNKESEQIAIKKKQKLDATEDIKRMKELGDKIKNLDEELATIEPELKEAVLSVPNIPHPSVPVGKEETDNVEIRKFSQPTTFDFEPKPHWEIGEKLGIIDAATGGKIAGARFTVMKGLGARLERSVYNFMLNTHTEAGYEEIFPPFMVNRESMYGTGQLPKFEEDAFSVKNNGFFLIPTAEVPVTNMLRGDIVDGETLPLKYCAYTACFRAEAGSAGRDTRGLIRQHQFNKVELVEFCKPEDSLDELEKLTASAENILKLLKLPYRVVALCTGDIGFSSAKTFDIEVWMPSYNRYVEISSCSDFMDYQARRMNIKYRENGKTAFVHTLNGSGLAVGRTVAAIIENYQQADGSVKVPDALVEYMGCEYIGK
ncbi:MAG: serine--tRNA ligase [Clostridia bacterium]|nr:serine--tRNA ligase [Clostridia bacterium]